MAVDSLAPARDGSAEGVSERRAAEAERELRSAQERFAGAFSGAPIGMALVGTDGSFLQVNRALCGMLARDEASLLALDFQAITHPDDLVAGLDQVTRMLSGELADYTMEKRYVLPDGSVVWGLLAVSLVRRADGEPDYFVSQIQDITARKAADEELRRQTAHLVALERPAPCPAPDAPLAAGNTARGPVLGERARIRVGRLLDAARDQLSMEIAFVAEVGDEVQTLHAVAGREAVDLANGAGLPAVDGYVGIPLERDDGHVYATLCCVSREADHDLREREVALMRFLAKLIVELIDTEERHVAERRGDAQLAGIKALISALDARDHYTGEHSKTVVDLAVAVGRRLGLEGEAIGAVEQVAVLHDIGKVGIPDVVLQKRGPLDEREWELMRQHPAVGERIVAAIPSLSHLAPAVRAEHEQWNGEGYPDGLRGAAIPLTSRITLACDAWHAMTSDRPYRAAMSGAEARRELRACAGTQFDPAVIDALLDALG